MNQMIQKQGVQPLYAWNSDTGINYVDKMFHLQMQIKEMQTKVDGYRKMIIHNGMPEVSGLYATAHIDRYVEARVDWERIALDSEPSPQKITGNTHHHTRERVRVVAKAKVLAGVV